MKLKIKQIRKSRKMTLQDLEDRTGISNSYISQMENGRRPINNHKLAAIAKALGVSPLDLIEDDGMSGDILAHLRIVEQMSDADRAAVMDLARRLSHRAPE